MDVKQNGPSGFCPRTHNMCVSLQGSRWREVELYLQPRKDHEQGGVAGLRKLDLFRFRLFLNGSETYIVFVTLPKHGS